MIDEVCIPLKTIERWEDMARDPHQVEKIAYLWAELYEIVVINQLANEMKGEGEE